MRFLSRLAVGLAFFCGAVGANASAQEHVVSDGQTLGRIAKRYGVSIEAICKANGIRRRAPIKAGQRLIIPDKDDPDGASDKADADETTVKASLETTASERTDPDDRALGGGLRQIDLPGSAPAYYYEPEG